MRQVLSPEALDAVDWVPIEVPAGGAAFHDGWVLARLAAERARATASGGRSSAT